jgi:chorismate synthase
MTSDWSGNESSLKATGRHDPCVLPRAMPIIEAMASIVVMDFVLIQLSRVNSIIVDKKDEEFLEEEI